MKIRVLAVGSLKGYLREGAEDFITRLGRLSQFELLEFPALPDPSRPSRAAVLRLQEEEGGPFLRRLRENEYVVALDAGGRSLDSFELADFLRPYQETGGRLAFLIGGSWGLSDTILKRADTILSLSRMTFTHGIARLVLLEQLFRAIKILRGETYHK